jgi:acyl carrier protein
MNNALEERILSDIRVIFVESFELDAEMITMDALLYDDLDIDSIDAVDLIIALKEKTGKKIDAEIFKQIRTVGDVVKAIGGLFDE